VVTALLVALAAGLVPSALSAALEQPAVAVLWFLLLSASSVLHVSTLPAVDVETTLKTPASIASLVVLEPSVAFLVNLFALVGIRELRDRPNAWMVLFNHAQTGLGAYAVALALHGRLSGPIAVTLAAVPLLELVNVGFVATAVWLLGRSTFLGGLRDFAQPFPRFTTNNIAIALLALLIVVLYAEVAPWAVALLALPLWLGYAAQRAARAASDRAEELAERVRGLEVVHDLGTALLEAAGEKRVAELGTLALRGVCDGRPPQDVAVVLDGRVPAGLDVRALPGTDAVVGLPPDLDARRAEQVDTVCNTVGLALQRLRVEEELRAAQRAQAELAEGILAEGTKARSRVALHVHDEVLPFLAAAEIQSENVVTAAGLGDLPMTIALAHKVGDAVSDGIATLREVIEDLRKQTIVPGDLVPFVQRAAEKAQLEHGIRVRLDVGEYRGGLSHPVEILLTETVTNLLCNAVKHAHASTIDIRVASGPDLVTAEVRDDGVGFDPDEVGVDRHGIALMRQRAAIAGGHFFLDTAPGRGTRICVLVPGGAPRPGGGRGGRRPAASYAR
jgi:signal transduction histidine kinase